MNKSFWKLTPYKDEQENVPQFQIAVIINIFINSTNSSSIF